MCGLPAFFEPITTREANPSITQIVITIVGTGLALSNGAFQQDCTVHSVTCIKFSIKLIRGRGKPLHYNFDVAIVLDRIIQ